MGHQGWPRSLTPPNRFARWRREERQDARLRDKDHVTQPPRMGRGNQDSHTKKTHTCGGWEKDKMGATTSIESCASWKLSLLICTMGLRKSVIYIPILQMRKQRLDQRLLVAELTGLCHVAMRCKSSLQTLLSVSRVVATKSTPEESRASMGAAPGMGRGVSQESVCARIYSLKDLRDSFIHALGGTTHATCKCRN